MYMCVYICIYVCIHTYMNIYVHFTTNKQKPVQSFCYVYSTLITLCQKQWSRQLQLIYFIAARYVN